MSIFSIFKNKPKEVIETKEEKVVIEKDIFDHYIENDLKVSYPLYIGSEVISVSNEPNSVSRGEIIYFETITKAKNIVPIVQFEDGKEFMCLSTLLPYTEEKYKILKELDKRGDKSAWNYVAPSWCQLEGIKFRNIENSIYKNSEI